MSARHSLSYAVPTMNRTTPMVRPLVGTAHERLCVPSRSANAFAHPTADRIPIAQNRSLVSAACT